MKHKSWTVLPFLCIPSLCCHAQAITDSAMRSSTIASAGVPAAKVQTNGTLPAATSGSPHNAAPAPGSLGSGGNVVLVSDSYTTPAASQELAKLSAGTQAFPAQWTWDTAKTHNQPRAATPEDNLTPRIEQYRGRQLIATWKSFDSDPATCKMPFPSATNLSSGPAYIMQAVSLGCGPFGNIPHLALWRFYQDGDTFLVYPAVYTGENNNIVITPKPDYYHDPNTHTPKNITIKGVTRNGIRPVLYRNTGGGSQDYASAQGSIYLMGGAENTVIENIDVELGPQGTLGKSAVYINGVNNLTLRQMRIHGFAQYGANGVFGTNKQNRGTLLLDQVELYENGGADGPAHNLYVGEGADPNFTVHMVNSWSHDAVIGHLFKSRAQVNILEGNYFQGGLPRKFPQAENWLVDIPNGGRLTMRNNILVKNKSGPGSNGASVTFAVEGPDAVRAHSVDIQNNTFVAFTKTYDGERADWPFFFRKSAVPANGSVMLAELPSPVPVMVTKNVFVGYLPQTYQPNAWMNYRGDMALTVAFSELNLDFSLATKVEPPPGLKETATNIGRPAYSHAARGGLTRRKETIGAVD